MSRTTLKPGGGAAALLALVLAPAWVGPSSSADASAFGASWEMNDTVGAMKDATGNGNEGALHSVTRNGSSYGFNGSSSYVSVPNDPTLNPGTSSFSIAMRLKLDSRPASNKDFDLLRKGLAGTKGGDYLVEIRDTGKAFCRVRGSSSLVTFQAGPNLADGKWHVVQCVKTSSAVRLVVDGANVATKTVRIGSISNGSALYIGAKPGDDFTDGLIDWARLKLA